MWPGGNIYLARLFEDAREILGAILNIIKPIEAERDAPQALLRPLRTLGGPSVHRIH